MSNPEAGWHADPAGTAGTYRWWDGQAWTRWLTHDPAAPAPAEGPPPVEPVAGAAVETGVSATTEPALPAEPLVRLPAAVAIVVGVLVLAVVAVGAVVAASAQRLPSGPAVAPPPRTAGQAVSYEASTRAMAVGDLRLTLPASPYACDSKPGASLPTFELAIACNAPVHESYDKQDHTWTATLAVGSIPTTLVTAGDLEATGRKVFTITRGQLFSRQTTTVTKVAAQPTDLGPGGKAMVVSGEVHYRVPGVPSRYDRLLVVVVALPDGTHGAVASSRPNDSGSRVQKALQASLDTIAVR